MILLLWLSNVKKHLSHGKSVPCSYTIIVKFLKLRRCKCAALSKALWKSSSSLSSHCPFSLRHLAKSLTVVTNWDLQLCL